ncbi:MAG: GGDEF domain-containing protein [Pseudomonadota bacterium]|nr:GGDEF domain-containing protein [Pseudomonadota bacterium]
MIKNLQHYWQRGKNSLMAIFASGGNHKHPLLPLPQLAFSGISLTKNETTFPLSDNNHKPPQRSQPLRFLKTFFDAITRIQDAGLLSTAGRLLYQLADGESIIFVEYQQGKLTIHSASRRLNHKNDFGQRLIQASLAAFRKLPASKKDIRFEILSELDDLAWQAQTTISPLPGPHKIAPDHFLAAFIIGRNRESRPRWTRETDQLLHFCLQHVAIRMGEINALEALRLHANTDPLTGVHNRRFFHEVLSRESERSNRHNQPLSLIILDIDHFKVINDTFGHLAGDQVLREIGRITRENIRAIDMVCRYGGEEFAIILPQTELEAASLIAERLRTSIAEFPFSTGEKSPLMVTASLGVACWHGSGYLSKQGTELIQAADRALYAAKDTGRNRTCTAQQPQGKSTGKSRKSVVFVSSAC